VPKLTLAVTIPGLGLVLLLGVYLLGLGIRNVNYALASVGWPKTTGVVAGSEMATTIHTDKKTRIDSVTWSTETVIRYRPDGVERATDLIRIGQTLGSGDVSEAELKRVRYPTGSEVSVSYHPSKPWIACVKPGMHADAFWLIGAGLAFIVPVVMCVVALAGFRDGMHGMGRGGDRSMAVVAGMLGAVFCGLGVLGVASGFGRIWHGHASQNWPSAEGEVVYSQTTESDSRNEETHLVSTAFSPRFVYRYEVDGRRHFNNLRRFGRVEGSDAAWAAEIASRYPMGAKVPVRYLPSDPDIAVLEPGNGSEAWWLPGAALVSLLFGMAVLVFVVPSIAKGF
jgi:hypothetical protein